MLTLLIDCHYLAWRAYYSTGQLSHQGRPTGVLYGFLRDVKSIAERYNTSQLVFTFDSPNSLRKQAYPAYKSSRHSTTEKKQMQGEVAKQIEELWEDILPDLGYLNTFLCDGYEADDIIASICCNYNQREFIIISGDADLYQLITKRVSLFNPRESIFLDLRKFKRQYEIDPSDWAWVKAIAGCSTDDISGVPGVGEKTAIKYLQGRLSSKYASFKRITRAGDLIHENLRLVRLPYRGCPDFALVNQPEIDPADWKQVFDRLGIKSMKAEKTRQRGFFD